MSAKLSVLMITKNAAETLEKSLASIKKIADEIIIVDSNSTDRTVEIAKNYLAKVHVKEFTDIGKQRMYGFKKATCKWVLILDCDEIVSEKLMKEIKLKIDPPAGRRKSKINSYYIPYQNFFLNTPLQHGGENYKMIRLFRRVNISILPSLVHNKIEIKNKKIGYLKGRIFHHSYRSIMQTYKKFTDYAIRTAKEKFQNGEQSSFKKIFIYPIHMFWARFVKDKGYEDGFFRIPLDLGFSYMEFITYITLFLMSFPRRRESRTKTFFI